MDVALTPSDFAPSAAVDAFYLIAKAILPPQEKAEYHRNYIEAWGNDADRRMLANYLVALGWAEDPIEGDTRSAVLDREIIAALATEVMVRHWQRELRCETSQPLDATHSRVFRTWDDRRDTGPGCGERRVS